MNNHVFTINSETYNEKLNNPKWQFVRNIILERDDYTCTKCPAKKEWGYVMEVHHIYYISGRDPWEYQSDALTTLCAQCHRKEHKKTFYQKGEIAIPHISFYLKKLGF